MSFYQPSLSLFDVLNALSDHAPPRNQRHGPNQGFPNRRTYPRGPQQTRYNGMNPLHGPYSMARNDFFDPFAAPANVYYDDDDGYPGATYLYGHPYDSNPGYYYYIPQFNRDDEDEEEREENEDDEKMGEDEDGVSKEVENPSYYHTRDGNNRSRMMDPQNEYQRRVQSRDYLNDLFDTFFGTPRNQGGEELEQQEEKDVKAPSDETTKEEHPNPAINENEVKQEKTENTDESTADKPTLKKKNSHASISSSFSGINGPSIITPTPATTTADPLKVSKPETRMDLPFTPEVNVYDLNTEYIVVLALPGSNSKAFKVDYHPTTHELIIRGNVTDKLGVDEKYLKLSEIKYGAFERTIKFPILPRIKDEEIKAKYSNGLLQINVPKMDASKDKPMPKKRITIEEIPDAELEFEKNPNPVEKI